MTFNNIHPQALVKFFNQHHKQLHLLVIVLLSLYLLAYAAQLLWRIIPQPERVITPLATPASTVTAPLAQGGVNLRQIQQLDLFGSVASTPEPVTAPVTEAPETNLNLTLTGVVASSSQQQGAAIIENRGTQNTYGLGEKIESTNATLDQVFHDRVIIKNGNRRETLMLDGVDFEEANNRPAQVQQPVPRAQPGRQMESQRQLSEEAVEATESIRSEPGNFTDYISIAPETDSGQLIGYKVKPGQDPALFESAGLQAGDVIVQINGLDLTDTQQSMEAMNELRNAETIELTITREGEYQTLYLDIPAADSD